MRLDVSRVALSVTYLATVVVVALLSDAGMARISTQFENLNCSRKTFGVDCVVGQPLAGNQIVLFMLLMVGLVVYLDFRRRSSRSNTAPFAMFLSGLLIVCVSFDLATNLHAHNVSKVYSSTVNTFTYILMFTFAVMLTIKEYEPVAFVLSVIGSFTVKILAFTALGLVMPIIPGATGMFALFVTYSFAAFGLHLMMACRLFVSTR